MPPILERVGVGEILMDAWRSLVRHAQLGNHSVADRSVAELRNGYQSWNLYKSSHQFIQWAVLRRTCEFFAKQIVVI